MLEIYNNKLEIHNIMLDESNTLDRKTTGKRRIIFLALFFIALIAITITILSWGLSAINNGDTTIGIIVSGLGILVVMIGGIYGRMYNQRTLEGMAIEDEMSTKQLYKAGYYSFVATFYSSVLMIILLNVITPARFVIYIGMSINALAFIILYQFTRREDLS